MTITIIIINVSLIRQKLAASCVAVVHVCFDVATRLQHILRFLMTRKGFPVMTRELVALLQSSL
jgi:hypothetical protein